MLGFRKHRKVWTAVGAAFLIAVLAAVYDVWFSRTKIAFVNFQPVTLQAFSQANDNPMIKLHEVSVDNLDRLGGYDVVLVTGMGLQVTAEQRQKIQAAADKGIPVYTMMATNPDNNISNFTVEETALLQKYMMSDTKRNCRSMLNFLRRNVDGKLICIGEIHEAEQKPDDYLYYPVADGKTGEDERIFLTVSEFDEFMEGQGLFTKGAKKIVVSGLITDPTDLIKALSGRGYNVYPVSSFLHLLEYVEEIRPSAVINIAHGRLGDEMAGYLAEHDIPLFDPLNVNMPVDEWEKDQMGMSGGFLSQSVVMPEIDGAIRTCALFALRKDKDGLLHPYAVPERLEMFVETVDKYMTLQTKANGEKRLAIVYYKGPGQGNLTASGMDVAQSLYNTLLHLKGQGYNVDGLPGDVEAFKRQIRREGSVFNAFAEGDADKFMKQGNPQFVSKEEYDEWTAASLVKEKITEVDKQFGAFPGDGNHLQADGKLAFPCIRYGNVVLLPQPIAGEGKDVFKITHGTGTVPPHSYIAPYLWIQHGFKADALLHYGTHGSLEFTPQKQVALSCSDWPDRLVGTLPHFYYYTIDNVGEAMTAKRRSYAQLLSYLTPAFHESRLRDTYNQLESKIRDYGNKKGDLKALVGDIKKLAVELGLHKDLGLDGDLKKEYSSDDIGRIGDYAEELASEKITDTPYVMGVPYSQEDIRNTVLAMTTDPVAYGLYTLDRLSGKAPAGLANNKALFRDRYIKRAESLAASFYGSDKPLTATQLASITGLPVAEIDKADSTMEAMNAPKGMIAMMMAASRKQNGKAGGSQGNGGKSGMEKMLEKAGQAETDIPEPNRSPVAKLMQWNMRKMLAKKDPSRMLAVAKKMGASPEALKKMEEGLREQMGLGGTDSLGTTGKQDGKQDNGSGTADNGDSGQGQTHDKELANAISELRNALGNISKYKRLLSESPQMELNSLVAALDGGYTQPSPGGDPIVNPNTLPTGRNLFAINAEETPTADAWEKGIALANNTIEDYRKRHNGEYPRKVSYTLWSGEFIQTGGATIAQVLYMLGVEPVRDRYGRVSDIQLIPSGQLGRPRIDVVVQTSGQLRDLAASRLFLIHRAVQMAAQADGDTYANGVKAGVEESERYLIDKGVSPKEARELSTYRVFGGAGGNYGTGIQSMVEQGGAWDDEQQIADVYMNNMGTFYGDKEHWMTDVNTAFTAALTRTDVVVQPRQNNTWGALSLDHVYEFMGGMNLAVRNVTGKDPDAYFSDYRNRNNYRMQDSKEAIGVEARTKLLNPEYVKNAMKGGVTTTDEIAEMVRNAYGWNVMKPKNIDKEMWDEVYDVYVKDKYSLGVQQQFADVNPSAMMELTATMMETARKGYWEASPEQLADIATVHTELVNRFGPSGSAFEGNNPKLQAYIADKAPTAAGKAYKQSYNQSMNKVDSKGMVMEKQKSGLADTGNDSHGQSFNGIIVVGVALVIFIVLVCVLLKKRE